MHGVEGDEAAAVRAGLRSGAALVLNFSRPCPAEPAPMACRAILTSAGECEADGQRWMRFTVEQPATGGGTRCAHADGTLLRRPC